MKNTETIPAGRKTRIDTDIIPRVEKYTADELEGLTEEDRSEIAKLGEDVYDIDQKFAFLGPYSFEVDIVECHSVAITIINHRLHIGARLCRIRAHEGQKRFQEAIGNLGIKKSWAYCAIAAAAKYLNETGGIKYPNIVALGNKKSDALTYFNDPELEILDAGGSVNGMTIETIDSKSSREVEKAIKKLKAQNEALSKMIVKKKEENLQLTDQLEEMEKQVNRPVDWSARSAEILAELNKILMEASQLNGRLNALVDEVHGMQETEWTKEESVCLQQAKFVASTISDDASVTVDRLDWLAPKVNAAFFPGLNFNRGHADDADDADYTVVDGEGEDA
nr:hypothetical protein [uncultured Sphaerochaeta sp.]